MDGQYWWEWAKQMAYLTWLLSAWAFVSVFVSYHLPPIINEYPDAGTSIIVAFFIAMVGWAWHAGDQISDITPVGED